MGGHQGWHMDPTAVVHRQFNVHWVLDGLFRRHLVSLNRRFVEQCGSEIDFGAAHQPHMTLLMGRVNDEASARERLTQLASMLAPITFSVTAPYLERSKGVFVFVDPVDAAPFVRSKHLAQAVISTLLEPSEFGGPEVPPHVSIAVVRAGCRIAIGPTDAFDATVTVRRVALSPCGSHGTCLAPIAEAEVSAPIEG